jgi:hypothetical protein
VKKVLTGKMLVIRVAESFDQVELVLIQSEASCNENLLEVQDEFTKIRS